MSIPNNFIRKLEEIISYGTVERRVVALNHVTEMFLSLSGASGGVDTDILDEVFVSLVKDIEHAARKELSIRLADVPTAPPRIMRVLASDDSIDVAEPVLSKSEALGENEIVEIVKTRSQEYLLAVSSRKKLSPVVTDVLISRGNSEVLHCTARNNGAQFSEAGYQKLVDKAAGDDELAHFVGGRPDIPQYLFLDLVAKASEAARKTLLAISPTNGSAIQSAISSITNQIRSKVAVDTADYSGVHERVRQLELAGELTESKIESFAQSGNQTEATVALAVMARLPIDLVRRAMTQDRMELVLIIAKAIGLSWPTTKAILFLRSRVRPLSGIALERCLRDFERLKTSTAQQAVRFYLLQSMRSQQSAKSA